MKELLLLLFVLLATALIGVDTFNNIVGETGRQTASVVKAQPAEKEQIPVKTLSEEEMRQWTERLKQGQVD